VAKAVLQRTPIPTYHVERVGSVARFLELEPEWNRLAANFSTPLLHHEWFAASVDAFLGRSELAIFVVRDALGLVHAIAPFVLEREGAFQRLRLLGYRTLEPAGLLYEDRAALKPVIDAIATLGIPLELRRLAAASCEMSVLCDAPMRRAVRIIQPGHASSTWARLESSAEALEAKLSPGRRSELRRKRKQAEQGGAVTFEAVVPTEATVAANLDRLFEVEASGWKGRAKTAILADAPLRQFYTRYAAAAAGLGELRFFFLGIGGETAAAIMAVEHAERLWELKIGFQERWSKCSPGLILAHETLRHASDQGLAAYEFLGGSDGWQERWPHAKHAYSSFRSFPLSPSGGYFLAKDIGSALWRRATRPVKT
jgi:CelD/BcsL family acetyltransferase involved in cellulose biosynthesis